MNKVFINIKISATGNIVELKVSPKIKVGQLTTMLCEYLKGGVKDFAPGSNVRLCDAKSGSIYPYNASLLELNVNDGQDMLLI